MNTIKFKITNKIKNKIKIINNEEANLKKQKDFFTKKKTNFWFFFIPILIIVLANIGLLIATSWYSIDFKIAEVISKGLSTEFGKYWSRGYGYSGNTELIAVMMIYIALLFESIFLKKIAQKKLWWKENYWIVNIYYLAAIIGFLAFSISRVTWIALRNGTFGPGIDTALLDSIKYRVTGGIVAIIYQTIILGFGFYYVRYKLAKTNRLLTEHLWFKSAKVLTFFVFGYIIVLILKGTMNRVYYFNTIFGDLFEAFGKKHPELVQKYLETPHSGIGLGYGAPPPGELGGFNNNIPPELQYPWWKSSLPLRYDPNMPHYKNPWQLAFPSGHMNATCGVGSLLYIFYKKNNKGKANWWIKTFFIIWIIHFLSMNFALVMERMHWMSDTAFTIILTSIIAIIVNFVMNKLFAKKLNLLKTNKQELLPTPAPLISSPKKVNIIKNEKYKLF